ncbi:zinc finger protein 341-like isoform X2 [Gigantopelta aegis]|uniref:zinc finger protein 341-like isoform X2 n=1 Tax=Gigantopelta aegis TaxID=1735272 RepID=UPI001B88D3B6|nr:zinc finger protein 341-like isoform X2 [Gigantopelta aegis]
MAQSFFDALTGSSVTVDNQTAVAVQSLLDSQTVGESQVAEEDDLFQCGKCKKQFTYLSAFVSHKQTRCTPTIPVVLRSVAPGNISNASGTFTSTVPVQRPLAQSQASLAAPTYGTLPTSPLSQLPQNMVLTDDLMTFNIDPGLQAPTIQMVTAPFTNVSRGSNVTILSPVNSTPSFSTNGSTLTNTVVSTTIPITMTPQVTITTIPDCKTQSIVKPSPTKAGRKSAQSNVIAVFAENQSVTKILCRKRADTNEDEASSKRKLRCQYCDKAFSKNFDLQQHIRAHTGEKPFQCIVCGRAFAQKSNVKKHMSTHKVWPVGSGGTLPKQPLSEKYISEDETSMDSSGQQQIQQDVADINSETQDKNLSLGSSDSNFKVFIDNSYICQYCPSKFHSYFQLKSHMVQHKHEQVYRCVMKNCSSTFQDLDSFLEHIKQHETDMSYRCHMCNKYFPSLFELGVHQYTHSLYPNQGPKPGPRHFQCTKCMNKYSSPEALEHHMATTTHNYACPHCDKVFMCERYLRRHLPTHGTEGQFECYTCLKKFKTEHYLKMHMLIHTGEKPFPCELCAASFNRKDKLKRHMLIHESTKKYKCPFKSLTGCSKAFNRPDKLKAHILTHSGVKPFKCLDCGKGFSRRPHLIEHERGHRADYKFRCDKCGKGFFRPKLFNEHKCRPNDGSEPQVFRPRCRRKLGRPRKKLITITREIIKEANSRVQSARLRNRVKQKAALEEAAAEDSVGEGVINSDVIELDNMPRQTVDLSGGCTKIENLRLYPVVSDVGSDHHQKVAMGREHELHLKETGDPSDAVAAVDHYIVHLQDPADGSGPVMQTTFIPAMSGAQLMSGAIGNSMHISAAQMLAGAADGTMQPIAIIEAQPLQITVTGADPNMQDASSSSMPIVSMTGADSVVTTQVVVASNSNGEHTFVTCPAHLVDYGNSESDPVLEGTENLLKASEEILHASSQDE